MLFDSWGTYDHKDHTYTTKILEGYTFLQSVYFPDRVVPSTWSASMKPNLLGTGRQSYGVWKKNQLYPMFQCPNPTMHSWEFFFYPRIKSSSGKLVNLHSRECVLEPVIFFKGNCQWESFLLIILIYCIPTAFSTSSSSLSPLLLPSPSPSIHPFPFRKGQASQAYLTNMAY